jgi:hypothetical protein
MVASSRLLNDAVVDAYDCALERSPISRAAWVARSRRSSAQIRKLNSVLLDLDHVVQRARTSARAGRGRSLPPRRKLRDGLAGADAYFMKHILHD